MHYILAKYGKDHLTLFIHLYQLIYQSIPVTMVLRLSESAINRYLTHQLTIIHKVASVRSLEYWRNMCWFEIDRFIIQTNRYKCRNINYFSLNLTDNSIGDGRIDAETRNAISTLQALILFYRFTEIIKSEDLHILNLQVMNFHSIKNYCIQIATVLSLFPL